MIRRYNESLLAEYLSEFPAVALIGPRQVGKTTLALETADRYSSIYLDLESEVDRIKLSDPVLYLGKYPDELLILDEVHRLPNLFQELRGLIDQRRRQGKRNRSFLLLGSAAIDLLRQSGESLAGRIAYLELTPLHQLEIEPDHADVLWLRGGFPDSYLSRTDAASLRWRLNFIKTYLERDIPQFGPRIPAETLRRFWTMLAHAQGGAFNAAKFAGNLGVDGKTIASYLNLLVDLLLVRRLPPWHKNIGKRLVKSPKVYVRDSGIVHALLGLETLDDLLSHPVVGASWEGFVIENLLSIIPSTVVANFYRTSGGAEVDLVLTFPKKEVWAIEIKRSLSPTVEKGFYYACEDIEATQRFVIYPGTDHFPLSHQIEVISLLGLMQEIDRKHEKSQ